MASCDEDDDGGDGGCCCCSVEVVASSFESNRESKKVDENGWVNWYRVSQKSIQNCDDVSWDAFDCSDAMVCFFPRGVVSCLLVFGWVVGCPVTFSPFPFRVVEL